MSSFLIIIFITWLLANVIDMYIVQWRSDLENRYSSNYVCHSFLFVWFVLFCFGLLISSSSYLKLMSVMTSFKRLVLVNKFIISC